MATFVFELSDRFAEGYLQLSYLSKEELRKAQKYRCVDAAFFQVVDYVFDIRGEVFILWGDNDQMALPVHAEIACAPIVDPVSLSCLLNYRSQICDLRKGR